MGAYGYPNLAKDWGWREGVHKAPVGYEHPWLVVTKDGTVGVWSRREAREAWRRFRSGRPIEWVLS